MEGKSYRERITEELMAMDKRKLRRYAKKQGIDLKGLHHTQIHLYVINVMEMRRFEEAIAAFRAARAQAACV